MSDNGASQEGGATGVLDEMRYFNGMREDLDTAIARLDDIGGPNSHCNIPWGWAQAGNTPLKWYKQNTHGGGVRDPLIIHWPAKLGTPGQIRPQFCHAIDLAPTVMDLLNIEPPSVVAGVPQMPVHGTSLAPALTDPNAATARTTQYFEMLGHRGIWHRGWKAVTHHESGTPFDDDKWELYHLDEDFSECNDLAAAEPKRLKEMVDLWWAEAERNGVLPLDDRGAAMLFRAAMRPGLPTSRRRLRLLSAHLTHRSRRVSVHGAWLDDDGRTRSPVAGRRRSTHFARQQQQRIRAVRETGSREVRLQLLSSAHSGRLGKSANRRPPPNRGED